MDRFSSAYIARRVLTRCLAGLLVISLVADPSVAAFQTMPVRQTPASFLGILAWQVISPSSGYCTRAAYGASSVRAFRQLKDYLQSRWAGPAAVMAAAAPMLQEPDSPSSIPLDDQGHGRNSAASL